MNISKTQLSHTKFIFILLSSTIRPLIAMNPAAEENKKNAFPLVENIKKAIDQGDKNEINLLMNKTSVFNLDQYDIRSILTTATQQINILVAQRHYLDIAHPTPHPINDKVEPTIPRLINSKEIFGTIHFHLLNQKLVAFAQENNT